MRIKTEIKKWGNSLAIRISNVVAESLEFKEGTKIDIDVFKDSLVIKPRKKGKKRFKLPYSETQLLRDITVEKSHAELITQPSGKEFGE